MARIADTDYPTYLLLVRTNRLLLPSLPGTTDRAMIATFNLNLAAVGYTMTPEMLTALEAVALPAFCTWTLTILEACRAVRGAHAYAPMYPNFPRQVMDASDAELYWNALGHYFTVWLTDVTGQDVIWLPRYTTDSRAPLAETVPLTVLRQGTRDELSALAVQLASANTSLAEHDKGDLRWLIQHGYLTTLPQQMPYKENIAVVGAMLLDDPALAQHMQTATDVLRLAVALSDGDVSLAAPTHFRSYRRTERRRLLGFLEQLDGPLEDMVRWRQRWLRLGERLHPGEWAIPFPKTARVFTALRQQDYRALFHSQVESLLPASPLDACGLLKYRPGELARRLDHLLRLDMSLTCQKVILSAWQDCASRVSTPVLLQVMAHFGARPLPDALRTFFPKGNVGKVQAIADTRASLPPDLCYALVLMCRETLIQRFAARTLDVGRVWVDPVLKDYPVPFGMRSANKGLRSLTRGSRVPLDLTKNTVRFFIWWHEDKERVDLDLSACLYDAAWQIQTDIAYFHLREKGYGWHSGDITSAKNGACEYIDLDLAKVIAAGHRYVLMMVNAYTGQKFSVLSACKAGWMMREHPHSGEIFEPATVVDALDLATDAKMGMPLIIDAVAKQMIWADVALTARGTRRNNVHNNRNQIAQIGHALTSLRKPSLFTLFELYAQAYGIADSAADADTVFSVEEGLPYRPHEIAATWMQ